MATPPTTGVQPGCGGVREQTGFSHARSFTKRVVATPAADERGPHEHELQRHILTRSMHTAGLRTRQRDGAGHHADRRPAVQIRDPSARALRADRMHRQLALRSGSARTGHHAGPSIRRVHRGQLRLRRRVRSRVLPDVPQRSGVRGVPARRDHDRARVSFRPPRSTLATASRRPHRSASRR